MKKFECTRCGLCCMKSPISILPYEDVLLRSIASKMGLKYRSRPGYRVYDRLNKVSIALSYVFELVDGKCIFLSRDYECMVQRIYKPLICRSFPYIPKTVSYSIVPSLKIIYSRVDYGVSIECPVIRDDQGLIQEMIMGSKRELLTRYFEREYEAANEMERNRSLLLTLLSDLWRRGVVEISDEDPKPPVVNLYDILRKHYPSLPYMLGIDKVVDKIKKL